MRDHVGKTFDVGERKAMTLVDIGAAGAVFCSNGKTLDNFVSKKNADCVFVGNRDEREITAAAVSTAAARRRKSRRRKNRKQQRTRRN